MFDSLYVLLRKSKISSKGVSMMFHSTEDPSPSAKDYLPDVNALISQAQNGDEQAFKLIYEHYFDRIYHYLTRMVGKEDIGSELTQETFLREIGRAHV